MPKKNPVKATTWRDLNSDKKKQRRKIPLSLRAKLRVVWIWLRAIVVLSILGAIGYGAFYLYQNAFFEEIFSAKSGTVKRIEFKTDGLMTPKWLNDFLKIPANSTLSGINIFAIKGSLESLSQVASASVERAYPDALKITISERKPFMKFFTEVSGEPRIFIMTLGGEFFEPSCVPADMIDAMPKLEGFAPKFDERLPQKFKSAEIVAQFLNAAYSQVPAQARSWKRIDVSEIDSLTLPLLKVITDTDIEIVFAPKDYKKQFDRLEYILRYQKENPLTIIKRIDLSIKGWAPVKIKTSR